MGFLRSSLLLCALLLSWPTISAEPPAQPLSPAQLLEQLELGGAVSGTFTQQKQLAGLDIALNSAGHFSFVDDALIWRVETPIATELKITSQEIVQFADGREAFRLSAEQQPVVRLVSDIFLAVFSGDWLPLQEHFALQVNGDTAAWQIHLKARNPQIARFAETIVVSGAQQLQSLSLREQGGDFTHIEFAVDP